VVTHAIRKRAFIQAVLFLAILAEISRIAHTSTNWVLYGTVSIEGTIVLAILDTAVLTYKRRCTIRIAKAITYTVTLTRQLSGARGLAHVGKVLVLVCVIITCLTCVCANLITSNLIVVTESTGTRNVGAVHTIITHVTITESQVTITMKRAIIHTDIKIEVPHFI
jgi:hypothetical protein